MVNIKKTKLFCRDDLRKIENYEAAMNDNTQTWHCHHRLELTLDGEFALSMDDLKRMGMYYHRPYYELIFLTKSEHRRLHGLNQSKKTRDSISNSLKGEKHHFYGKKLSKEHIKKLKDSHKGLSWKLVDGKRVWSKKEVA